jgi:hypothetical protein
MPEFTGKAPYIEGSFITKKLLPSFGVIFLRDPSPAFLLQILLFFLSISSPPLPAHTLPFFYRSTQTSSIIPTPAYGFSFPLAVTMRTQPFLRVVTA